MLKKVISHFLMEYFWKNRGPVRNRTNVKMKGAYDSDFVLKRFIQRIISEKVGKLPYKRESNQRFN